MPPIKRPLLRINWPKWLVRFFLRRELAHAKHQVSHWLSEIRAAEFRNDTTPDDVAGMMGCKEAWEIAVTLIDRDLADLDAPDDDSEQLSTRAIPSYMFWPK